MVVFEIVTPGSWLDHGDRKRSMEIYLLILKLIEQFFEANTALNLFLDIRQERPPSLDSDNWMRDMQRSSDIRKTVEMELKELPLDDYFGEVGYETHVRLKREKWASGEFPREFEHCLPYLYARAFVYALDTFDRTLDVLSKEANVPPDVEKIRGRMATDFPNLREVRNTAHHPEDRMRGLGSYNKKTRMREPLVLKPIDNGSIYAPNGAIVLDNLNGSNYGTTMSDGHYGEVCVSPESMRRLQAILKDLLSLFKWTGPKQHWPNI